MAAAGRHAAQRRATRERRLSMNLQSALRERRGPWRGVAACPAPPRPAAYRFASRRAGPGLGWTGLAADSIPLVAMATRAGALRSRLEHWRLRCVDPRDVGLRPSPTSACSVRRAAYPRLGGPSESGARGHSTVYWPGTVRPDAARSVTLGAPATRHRGSPASPRPSAAPAQRCPEVPSPRRQAPVLAIGERAAPHSVPLRPSLI